MSHHDSTENSSANYLMTSVTFSCQGMDCRVRFPFLRIFPDAYKAKFVPGKKKKKLNVCSVVSPTISQLDTIKLQI